MRLSETPAAPATGAGAPRAAESPGAPCSCCPAAGRGALRRRAAARLVYERVEGAERPGRRIGQEDQGDVQLSDRSGGGERRDVPIERLSHHGHDGSIQIGGEDEGGVRAPGTLVTCVPSGA